MDHVSHIVLTDHRVAETRRILVLSMTLCLCGPV